ncbi:hypothetical protein APHAL10511_001135 [Amanita phalloides]|nr:hypothetical protein APHAL10511_001135 [Amanita phalloides]
MLRLARLRPPPPRCPVSKHAIISRIHTIHNSSSNSSSPPEEEGIAPGIPPNSTQFSSSAQYLNIKLPDLTQPDPAPPVQIPYLPDFWDSYTARKAPAEQPLPKLLVVGDGSIHHTRGPTHILLEEIAQSETVNEDAKAERHPPRTAGILSDMATDLGLGPLEEIRKNWRRML